MFKSQNPKDLKMHIIVIMPLCVCAYIYLFIYIIFKRFYLLIFRVRERQGEKEGNINERDTSMCGCLSHTPHWGSGPQPRHVPWWKSNQRPFGSQASAQSTEPQQPGLYIYIIYICIFIFKPHLLEIWAHLKNNQ